MIRQLCPLIGALAVLLAACANPYHDFYRSNVGVPLDARTLPGVLPQEGPVQIFTSSDMVRDVREMQRRGYAAIGESSFNIGGNSANEANLRRQADAVGAQVVLLASKYTNTVSGAMPLVLPNNSTSYSSGTATGFGPGGPVTAYGTATTTTYGTTTTMVPYSVNRFDYDAVYFVRRKTRLGISFKALDDAQRQKYQSNSMLIVDIVVDGSPAFKADILPGDVIASVAGQSPGPAPDFLKRLAALQGQEVDIELLRGDQRITKHVHIDSY